MSATNYFKCYPSDFLNGVIGLSAQEIGVYAVLLMQQYDRRAGVPENIKALAARCMLRPSTAGAVVDRLIEAGKLVLENGLWSNPRAAREIEILNSSATVSQQNGTRGGRKPAGKSNDINGARNPDRTQTEPESRSQKPEAPSGAAPAPTHTREEPATPAAVALKADPGRLFSETIFTGFPEMSAAAARSPGLLSFGPVYRWLQAGADLELDIIPAVRDYLSRPKHTTPRTWDFFEGIITEWRQKRLASPLAAITPPPAPAPRLDENGRLRPSPSGKIWCRVWRGGGWDSFAPADDHYRPVWERAVAKFRDSGEWIREDLGPAPGEDGCVCPEAVIHYVDSGEMQREMDQRRQLPPIPKGRPMWDDRLH